ncbi:MAG: TraR/DksA C4-type zinc finger protein [Leucobacter sp.]
MRARRGESDDDEHDPEGETLSSRWSLLAGLLESAREDQRHAEAALRRLEEGSYGVCASCGEPIPDGQLEARPFRERCVPCANARR